jgi:hypothetical protein
MNANAVRQQIDPLIVWSPALGFLASLSCLHGAFRSQTGDFRGRETPDQPLDLKLVFVRALSKHAEKVEDQPSERT